MKLQNLIHILIGIVCIGFLPGARGVVPAPDGGYPGNNTAEGTNALFSLTSGIDNTALGFQALFHNTTGNYNTAEGFRALFANTNGRQNTATGVNALISNTTGNFNTANGVNALNHNTTGADNTATGVQALYFNNGSYNTADGFQALYNDTTGNGNTGSGYQALFSNRTGANNAAFGYIALFNNTGSFNTAFGSQTLVYNTTGDQNTAIGYQALAFNRTGGANTAIGHYSLQANTEGTSNTAVGDLALVHNTTGSRNIAIGLIAGYSLTTGSKNIYIGHPGIDPTENGKIRIGSGDQTATYIWGIAGQTVGAGGSTCYVDNAGKLGVQLSARRFKTDIADMNSASEALLRLRPVTFRYKPEMKATDAQQFGLIAEEVAEVNPNLVTHDAKGELSTVRYEAVNAMLLNEFLKTYRRIEEQEATITRLQEQIDAVTAGLKNVSAQLEVSKPAQQTVLNNQ